MKKIINMTKTKKFISVLLTAVILTSSLIVPVCSFNVEYDINDALNILKHLAKVEPLTDRQKSMYNINGNPEVGINDALEILRYLAKLDNLIVPWTDEQKEEQRVKNFINDVVTLVNAERAKVGLSPVTANNSALNGAAMKRAEEIVELFSHNRPDGSSCFTILPEFGIVLVSNYWEAENLARGQKSPQEVMDGWMNSEGHRLNILDKNAAEIGVGLVIVDGVYHWSQFFLNTAVR
ncbi:MAG: CAP domain-containing protein [Oscillospiraceae bacterium]|nr:CAP domain-containing protein [Oscillospiraceae bacterium]